MCIRDRHRRSATKKSPAKREWRFASAMTANSPRALNRSCLLYTSYGFLTVLNVLFGTPEQAGRHQTAERILLGLSLIHISGGQAPSGAARHCRTPVRTIYAARDSINMRRMPK